jgi:hypothetical protein
MRQRENETVGAALAAIGFLIFGRKDVVAVGAASAAMLFVNGLKQSRLKPLLQPLPQKA